MYGKILSLGLIVLFSSVSHKEKEQTSGSSSTLGSSANSGMLIGDIMSVGMCSLRTYQREKAILINGTHFFYGGQPVDCGLWTLWSATDRRTALLTV